MTFIVGELEGVRSLTCQALSVVPISRLSWSYSLSMWIHWLFLVASAYSLWIYSSREGSVWQWLLTDEQSLQRSFTYCEPETPSIRCLAVPSHSLHFVILQLFRVWAKDSLLIFSQIYWESAVGITNGANWSPNSCNTWTALQSLQIKQIETD